MHPTQAKTTYEWCRDPCTKQIWRHKSNSIVTHYQRGDSLGSGWSGFTHVLIPDQEQKKSKAVKTSSLVFTTLKKEYEFTLRWPKNAVGLLLRAKTYFSKENDLPEMYIMHRYVGTLEKIIEKLTLKQKIDVIFQILQGISTLHSLGIAHGDVHSRNVLYDTKKGRYDLSDFEHSVMCDNVYYQDLIEKDMQDLKELVESIVMGKEDPVAALISFGNGGSSYVQRLNTVEQVRELGFSDEASPLILQLYQAKTSEEMCQLFKSIVDFKPAVASL